MRSFIMIMLLFALSASAQKVLNLQESMSIAMENSPDIRQSELSLERSRQSLKAQKAALKSKFGLEVTPFSYSNNRMFQQTFNTFLTTENRSSAASAYISQPIYWTDGTFSIMNELSWRDSWSELTDEQRVSYSNNLYLRFDQPLFTYNRTKLATKELELDLENTQIQYMLRKLQLEYSVTQYFYAVYEAKLNLQIAQEEYENQKVSYDIIKNKVDAGLAAKEEFYQAELNLLSSESEVKNSQVMLQNEFDQFKKLIGLPIMEEIDILGDVSHVTVAVDEQMALNSGLENRMELRQRDIDIYLARQSLIETKAMNEFKGDISVTYGFIGDDSQFTNMYEKTEKNQRAEVSFTIPLFDWGERKARIRAQQAVIESNELSKAFERDDIIISIRQTVRSISNQVNQVEISRQNVKNAQLTYEINLERYRNGDLTSMDLNLYQTQLSEAKIGLAQSIINYKLELLNLKIQSMYDFEKEQPVLPDELIKGDA